MAICGAGVLPPGYPTRSHLRFLRARQGGELLVATAAWHRRMAHWEWHSVPGNLFPVAFRHGAGRRHPALGRAGA
jgi:hypothetical protein